MPLSANKNTSKGNGFRSSLIILVVWFFVVGLIFYNRQSIVDWYKLSSYKAPEQVQQVASQTTMTDYGKKVFYVNKPAIQNKAEFNQNCPNNGGERTNILGCYHGNQNGIYVYNVGDPRLDGVIQVTAAHEMLHAVYDRLSASEKAKVNAMLEDYYANSLTDERLKTTIDLYKKTEPNDVVNEMHSIFGTEIANLPPGLENYYKKFFTNRKAVAALSNKYQSVFAAQKAQVDQADAELDQLKTRIDNLETNLRSQENTLTSMQQNLNRLHNNGNVDAFNSLVPDYNARVRSFNADVDFYQGLIAQYNQILERRNSTAVVLNQLNNELSSQITQIRN